ncbi:MAG: transposase [Bacteroidota bacterium]
MEDKVFYRRHLPHYQPKNAIYHLVFRLDGSLPQSAIDRLRKERVIEEQNALRATDRIKVKGVLTRIREAHFKKFDALLDGCLSGPVWLRTDAVAAIVAESLHYRDGKVYDLVAYCIMPNHVHLLAHVGRPVWSSHTAKPSEPYAVTKILENLKWYTALKCNEVLGRSGQFWEHESYDHVVRDGRLFTTIHYVLDNPVKAGLVVAAEDWKWSYCKPGILDKE